MRSNDSACCNSYLPVLRSLLVVSRLFGKFCGLPTGIPGYSSWIQTNHSEEGLNSNSYILIKSYLIVSSWVAATNPLKGGGGGVMYFPPCSKPKTAQIGDGRR